MLENNAKKLKEIQAYATKSGAIINDGDLATLNQVNTELAKIKTTYDGLSNTVGVAGAELFKEFDLGNVLSDSLLSARALVLELKQDVVGVTQAWTAAGTMLGDNSSETLSVFKEMVVGTLEGIGILLDAARQAFTYFPVYASAAYVAAGKYGESWGLSAQALFEDFSGASKKAMVYLSSSGEIAFGELKAFGAKGIDDLILRLADLAQAMTGLSGIGMDGIAEAAAQVSQQLRAMANNGQQVDAELVAMYQRIANDAQNAAKENNNLAEQFRKDADEASKAGDAALKAAGDYRDNAEAKRAAALASHDLSQGYDIEAAASAKASNAAKTFVKLTYEIKAADQSRAEALKTLTEDLVAQRIAVTDGDRAAQYLTDRLQKLSDAEVRVSGAARQYNDYLKERDRLINEGKRIGAGLLDNYRLDLQDKGLDKPYAINVQVQNFADKLVSEQDKYTVSIELSTKAAEALQKKLQAIADSAANVTANLTPPSSANVTANLTPPSSTLSGAATPKLAPPLINTNYGVVLTKAFRDATAPFLPYIQAASKATGVDAAFIRAIIQKEVGYLGNPNRMSGAVSPKGAGGVMQLMPATGAKYGVSSSDRFNPEKAIMAGTKYLKDLLAMFGGNKVLAAAGYNAGENAVKKYGGVPDYKETKDYVRWVETYYAAFKKASTDTTKAIEGTNAALKQTDTNLKAAVPSAAALTGNAEQNARAINGANAALKQTDTNLKAAVPSANALASQAEKNASATQTQVQHKQAIEEKTVTINQREVEYNSLLKDGNNGLQERYNLQNQATLEMQVLDNATKDLLEAAKNHNAEITLSPALLRAQQLEQMQLLDSQQQLVFNAERLNIVAAESIRLAKERTLLNQNGNKRKEYEQGLRESGWYSESEIKTNGLEFAALAAARLAQESERAAKAALLGKEAFRAWELENIEGFAPSQVQVQMALEKTAVKAGQFRQVWEGVMQQTEEALLTAVMTGKGGWGDLVQYMIREAIRLYAIKPLMEALFGNGSIGSAGGLIGGFVGRMGFGGGRAHGGSVARGSMYEVNETGVPELLHTGNRTYLMNTADGYVQPLRLGGSSATGGSATQVAININHQVINHAPVRVSNKQQTDTDGIKLVTLIEPLENAILDRMSQGRGLAPALDSRYGRVVS